MFAPVPLSLGVDSGGSLLDAVAYGIAVSLPDLLSGAVVLALVLIVGAVAVGLVHVDGNAYSDGFADGLAYSDTVRGGVDGGVGAVVDPAVVGPGVWRRPTEHDDRSGRRGGVV